MIPSLSQETLTQYASDAQTIQEPTGTDYSKGVSAGRTIPAKWWNWLFSAVTKRAGQSKTDAQNMLTELKNVVTDAGITPDAEDDTQLSQAVAAKADTQINNFVSDKLGFMQKWFIAGTEGLPDMPGASGWRYQFERLHCVHGVYFAFVRLSYGSTTVYNYVVYSYDLDTWHQIKPSDLGGNAALDEYFALVTSIVYYKGAWYFAFQGTPSPYGQGINGHFSLTKVPDLEDLNSKTVLYSATYSTGSAVARCLLFVLGNYLCWKSSTQTASEIAISTDGTNFTTLDTGTALVDGVTLNAQNGWGVPETVPFNGGYLVGSMFTNADLTSWTRVTIFPEYMEDHVALLASGVAVFYSDRSYISFVEYMAPGDIAATKVDYFGSNTHIYFTHDKRYVYGHTSGSECKITSDFTDVATLSHGGYNGMMDTIDGELYAIDSNDNTIIKCIDISQDTWVSTGNTVPASWTSFIVLGAERVLGSGANVSMDLGATWKPSKDTKGRNFDIKKIDFIQDGKYFVQKGTTWFSEDNPGQKPDILFYAQRTVNYVQGHTLYLR